MKLYLAISLVANMTISAPNSLASSVSSSILNLNSKLIYGTKYSNTAGKYFK